MVNFTQISFKLNHFCSKGIKLVILDECDSMTSAAQFALRRSKGIYVLFNLVIEKYTKNTRFCLSCNYVSRIIPAILSRCTRFRFSPLKSDSLLGRLNEIAAKEL
jgi:replication factor C subunit 3/5